MTCWNNNWTSVLYSSRDDLVYSDPGHRPEENSGWARKLVSGKQKKNLKKVKTTNFGRSSVNCDDPFIIGRDRVRHTYSYFSHLFSFFFTITVFFIFILGLISSTLITSGQLFLQKGIFTRWKIACDDLYQLFWIIGILENQQLHKNAWHPLIIVTDTRVVLCQAADIHCDKFWDPFFLWCNRDIVAVMHFLMTWQYSKVCIIEMRARWTWNRFWCNIQN